MRTVTAIRHAHSTANVSCEPHTTATAEDIALANHSAGLTPRGEEECATLRARLPRDYGITPPTTRVATSEFRRTQLTAARLGFVHATAYPVLNEAPYNMPLADLREQLRQNKIPASACRAAEALLQQPPPEAVWVTHALLVAGMCIILGIAKDFERPTPHQCEVRSITF